MYNCKLTKAVGNSFGGKEQESRTFHLGLVTAQLRRHFMELNIQENMEIATPLFTTPNLQQKAKQEAPSAGSSRCINDSCLET